MSKRIVFLLKTTLFWLILFALARALFECYNYACTKDLTISEISLTFLHGFRLDLSITSYFLLLYGLLTALTVFIRGKRIVKVVNTITILLILTTLLIIIVDVELYRNWGFRMDATPLQYLKTPGAALASTPVWATMIFILIWISLTIFSYLIYRRFVSSALNGLEGLKWYYFPLILLITSTYIISGRGTLTEWPIRVSTVAFSTKQFANHASINVVWNFFNALRRKNEAKINVQIINNKEAEQIFSKLQSQKDSTEILLNTKQPNVVILILESFSADAIEYFGGKEGITPNLNSLAKEGISFTNFYSTSYRSNVGLMAILAGYPAQHEEAILLFPNKLQNLPSLAAKFKNDGYSTAFYYGGDSDFANLNSFIKVGGYEKLEDLFSFPKSLPHSSWGIHDHVMFDHLINEMDQESKPFFKVLYTLSSHEPFDVPGETRIKGNDEDSRFLNSVAYTDHALGEFMKIAKTKPWWNNTLFVITADHSVRFIYNRPFENPRRFSIPMVWLGGALAKDSFQINKISSQQDIPSTILAQLGKEHNSFKFSNNILNKNSEGYAVYIWPSGFGLKKKEGALAFHLQDDKVYFTEGDTTNITDEAKSLFQTYVNDFNNKEFDKPKNN